MKLKLSSLRVFLKRIEVIFVIFTFVTPCVSVSSVSRLDSSGFVNVLDYVPDTKLDLRYYSNYNFVGKRIEGYEENIAIATKEAAEALKKARELLRYAGCILNAVEDVEDAVKIAVEIKDGVSNNYSSEKVINIVKEVIEKRVKKQLTDEDIKSGLGKYTLKIFDAYRPQCAVDDFVEWAKNDDVKMKEYFYPNISKSEAFERGYIAKKSGHSRGSTFDLTICDLCTGEDLDMGGTFDYFGERSHYAFKDITPQQKRNRQLLHFVMEKSGFKYLREEWWHFTLKNEPYPEIYFEFHINSKAVPSKLIF